MDIVIFDLETTGFSPHSDEIIQIAAVRMRDREVITGMTFQTFVRPENGIPSQISAITGITSADVKHAPQLVPSLEAFSRFSGDAILVAHNGRRFDLRFIHESCRRHRMPLREVPFFDSMTLSRRLWPEARSHNLDSVVARLGISGQGQRRHDARGDVQILAEAVRLMWSRLGVPPDSCPVPTEVGYLPK